MIAKQYQNIKVLLVDSVHAYRQSVTAMLRNEGITNVVGVGSADEALTLCANNLFDLIICDYSLSGGLGGGRSTSGEKNGLQLLEELREKKQIDYRTIFAFLSSESSKSIVVSAYDQYPDIYLTKPINEKDLNQRLLRLLVIRDSFLDVYPFVDSRGNLLPGVEGPTKGKLIETLEKIIASHENPNNRCRIISQKILGKIYLKSGEYQFAEQLYREVLEVSPCDWAKLGMVCARKGAEKTENVVNEDSIKKSIASLEAVIELHPLFLEAYDQLNKLYLMLNNKEKQIDVLRRVAEQSPYSILRQEELAVTAMTAGEFYIASTSFYSAVKIGKNSVYDKFSNYINFGRSANFYLKNDPAEDPDLLRDSIRVMEQAPSRFKLAKEELAQLCLVKSHGFLLQGNIEKSDQDFDSAIQHLSEIEKCEFVDTELDFFAVKKAKNIKDDIENPSVISDITSLAKKFESDEKSLEKIDQYLDEPVSKASKKYIEEVNKEGIHHFDNSEFIRSIDCFEKAVKRFPLHILLHLNLVQALHGFCQNFVNIEMDSEKRSLETDRLKTNEYMLRAKYILDRVSSEIDTTHSEYSRYLKLQQMVASIKR